MGKCFHPIESSDCCVTDSAVRVCSHCCERGDGVDREQSIRPAYSLAFWRTETVRGARIARPNSEQAHPSGIEGYSILVYLGEAGADTCFL